MALESQKGKMAASKGGTLGDYIKMLSSKINVLLPDGIDPHQYINMLGTILTADSQFGVPHLDIVSFKDGVLKCAQAGLLPNTTANECYLTVTKTGNVKFMIGLGGRLKAATEAGLQVRSRDIRENDTVSLSRELVTGGPEMLHFCLKEGVPNRGKVIGYYASYFNLKNPSDNDAIIISKEEVEQHRKNSGGGPTWVRHFDAMAKNYCIKQLLRHYQFDLSGNGQIAAIMADEDSDDIEVKEKSISSASIKAETATPTPEPTPEKKTRRRRVKPEPEQTPEEAEQERALEALTPAEPTPEEPKSEEAKADEPVSGQISLIPPELEDAEAF